MLIWEEFVQSKCENPPLKHQTFTDCVDDIFFVSDISGLHPHSGNPIFGFGIHVEHARSEVLKDVVPHFIHPSPLRTLLGIVAFDFVLDCHNFYLDLFSIIGLGFGFGFGFGFLVW